MFFRFAAFPQMSSHSIKPSNQLLSLQEVPTYVLKEGRKGIEIPETGNLFFSTWNGKRTSTPSVEIPPRGTSNCFCTLGEQFLSYSPFRRCSYDQKETKGIPKAYAHCRPTSSTVVSSSAKTRSAFSVQISVAFTTSNSVSIDNTKSTSTAALIKTATFTSASIQMMVDGYY